MGCRCGGGSEHEHAEFDVDGHPIKSLVDFIDFTKSTAINVQRPYDLEEIIKYKFIPKNTVMIASDADEQILLKIQYKMIPWNYYSYRFTGVVKLKAISVSSLDYAHAPKKMKVYIQLGGSHV